MGDCTVRCTVCGREEHPGMASSLRDGWPRCCGYTMRLLTPNDPVTRERFYGRLSRAVPRALAGRERDG